MSGFLLDTNVVSELIEPAPNPGVLGWVDAVEEPLLFLSVLTIGEIRKGIMALRAGPRRARLEIWLDADLRSRFANRILPIDEEVADRWGSISAQAAARGKPVPVIDCLLAATALRHNLAFVTRNSSDVAVTGVRLLNPWS